MLLLCILNASVVSLTKPSQNTVLQCEAVDEAEIFTWQMIKLDASKDTKVLDFTYVLLQLCVA